MSFIIRDYVYSEFTNRLTIDIIKALNKNSIQIAKSMRITKTQMKSLFTDLFGYFPMFPMLFEQIFNRFRKAKCNVFNNQSAYFIRTITVDDEIDVYELCCALITFVKCEFQQKIGLLFQLSDLDDDGYINEEELKKMIRTNLILFSSNTNSIETNSTILNQSLAFLDANSIIDMLLTYPGELSNVFLRERCISFDLFDERLSLIPGHKTKLFPFYVNFKECLCTQPTEAIISLKKNNLREYFSISNNIILPLSPTDKANAIRPPNMQIKIVKRKVYPLKFKKDSERTKNNSSLKDSIKSTTQKRDFINDKCNANDVDSKTNYNQLKEFRVSYLKIKNLEAKPGRFHLIGSRNSSLPTIIQKKKSCLKKKKSDYKNVNELISEINLVSNINRKQDNSSIEMNKIEKKVDELGISTMNLLKNREDSDPHLGFGKLKLIFSE